MTALMKIDSLTVSYATRRNAVTALLDVSLEIAPGEVFGIVGESGCGKSTLSGAIGSLLGPNGNVESGSIEISGVDALQLKGRALRDFRAHEIGYVFQDPMAVMDPTKTVAAQFKRLYQTPDWRRSACDALNHVGLTDHQRVLSSYPHQLSGGMAQRVVIAAALIRKPKLLIADEPTAALDASIRASIMDLLSGWCSEIGAAMLIISHDIPIISRYCQRIGVMYAGRFVEISHANEFLASPKHPYASALMQSEPGHEGETGKLQSLDGAPPLSISRAQECAFAPRCKHAQESCLKGLPTMEAIGTSIAACCRLSDIHGGTTDG